MAMLVTMGGDATSIPCRTNPSSGRRKLEGVGVIAVAAILRKDASFRLASLSQSAKAAPRPQPTCARPFQPRARRPSHNRPGQAASPANAQGALAARTRDRFRPCLRRHTAPPRSQAPVAPARFAPARPRRRPRRRWTAAKATQAAHSQPPMKSITSTGATSSGARGCRPCRRHPGRSSCLRLTTHGSPALRAPPAPIPPPPDDEWDDDDEPRSGAVRHPSSAAAQCFDGCPRRKAKPARRPERSPPKKGRRR